MSGGLREAARGNAATTNGKRTQCHVTVLCSLSVHLDITGAAQIGIEGGVTASVTRGGVPGSLISIQSGISPKQ